MAVLFLAWFGLEIRDLATSHKLLTPEGQPILGGDFVNFWTAARLTLEGRVSDLFDFEAFRRFQSEQLGGVVKQLHWSYPPQTLLLIAGFGFLPLIPAYVLWTALTFAAFALAVAYRRPAPWSLTLILFFCPGSMMNHILGQNGFLTAALMIGGFRLLKNRPVWAGVLFGLLSFKPHLALLIPFALVASRSWKALAAAALTSLLLIGLSVLCWGLQPWVDYLHVTLPFQREILFAPVTASPLFPYLMPTPFMALRLLGASVQTAMTGQMLFAAGAVLATLFAFRKEAPDALRLGIVLTAPLLATPHALVYDMTLLNAAVIAVLPFAYRRKPSKRALALMLTVWLLPLAVPLLNLAGFPLAPLILTAFLALQIRWVIAKDA